MNQKKWTFHFLFTFPARLQEKYKYRQQEAENLFAFAAIRCGKFHLLLKYRHQDVDLKASQKSFAFISRQHRKFHLYI